MRISLSAYIIVLDRGRWARTTDAIERWNVEYLHVRVYLRTYLRTQLSISFVDSYDLGPYARDTG